MDKKLFYKAFLLSLILMVTIIDENKAQRFIGGAIGGFNFSQIDGDELAGFHKFGFNVGGYVSAVLAERWQLSMELLFSQQGSKLSSRDGFNAAFDRIHLNFVEVPVLINFEEWKFHVFGGASYAGLINSEIIDIGGVDVTDTVSLKEGVFSVVVGATYFPSETIGVNFRWLKAINDLRADEGRNKWLGRTISIRLLYLFN